MKKILITNDDGVRAEGIFEIARALCNDYEVYIVAPSEQKSGMSQSITFRTPLYLEELKMPEIPDVKVYSLTGTPADCVKFAIGALKINPDLIISGINLGANLGTDVYYSGTLGAATEAALWGYPALALSVVSHTASYVRDAARACKQAVDFYIENTGVAALLSVNVPNIPYSDMKETVITHLSRRNYPFYEKQDDGGYMMPAWSLEANENNKDSDEYFICKGHVTWTPVFTKRCDCDSIPALKDAFEAWKKSLI